MSQGNPVTGRPHGGRDEPNDDQTLPGEHPASDAQRRVAPPDPDNESETASRAAQGGAMSSREGDRAVPSEGIPAPVDAPSPADATEGDPPGGSVANQRGADTGT
jgi:hypothetical protein